MDYCTEMLQAAPFRKKRKPPLKEGFQMRLTAAMKIIF